MKAWKYQLFFWKYRLESWLKKWQKATGIFYIGGSDVFPPPLKPEEEALLLEQLGGEDDLQVKSVLIERNLRLVVYIARKFENTGINVEDLISIGTIGLIKAIQFLLKALQRHQMLIIGMHKATELFQILITDADFIQA